MYSGIEGRSTYLRLLLVSLLVVGASLLVNDLSRYLEWDEAIYFAEVSPTVESIGFDAHRARGTTLLALPVALLNGGVFALRGYILFLFGLGLLLGFRQWAKSVGATPALAGLLIFGTSWLSLFYSVELAPNLFVALVSIGLTGVVAADPARGSKATSASAVFMLAAVLALLRPLDALIIGVAIAWFRRHDPIDLAALLLGLAVGGAVWAVEAVIRFGGIWDRMERAADLTESTGSLSIVDHLRLLDGGLIGPDRDLSIPWFGVAWVVVLLVFAAIGAWSRRERVGIALVPGLVVMATYTLLVGALAPRFLLPAYGLLAVSAGVGLHEAWVTMKRRTMPLALGAMILFGVLAVTTAWQVRTAARIAEVTREGRVVSQGLGERLDEATDGSCAFASQYGYPQIAVASGCVGRRLDVGNPRLARDWLDHRKRSGDRVFVLVLHDPQGPVFFKSWPADVVSIEGKTWTIYGPPNGE